LDFTSVLVLVVAFGSVACYQGVSKTEDIYILQVASASSNLTATVVERSDHAALSGTTLFVFLSDHPYSMTDLRARLYALDPVFMAGGTGVSVDWLGNKDLTIRCHQCGMSKDIIQEQRFRSNGVAVRYVGFP
jgi:hypothetical protein